MKLYYGIRYFSGRTTTTGKPHPLTGRMSKACEIKVFKSAIDREAWLELENLSKPCGLDGGERIPATKRQCREHRLGDSVADFEYELSLQIES